MSDDVISHGTCTPDRYNDDVITHHVIRRNLDIMHDVDGCKGQTWLAGRLSLPASCLRWP